MRTYRKNQPNPTQKPPYYVHGIYACFYPGPFSQWFPCTFSDTDPGALAPIVFSCAEQAMMYRKAELFGDADMMRRIMATKNPREQKHYGRQVRNFDKAVWDKENYRILLRNNYLKFSQNEDLRSLMLDSGELIFVEASPYDKIYGIGRGLDYPHLDDPRMWRGENLLGRVLTETREILRRGKTFEEWVA